MAKCKRCNKEKDIMLYPPFCECSVELRDKPEISNKSYIIDRYDDVYEYGLVASYEETFQPITNKADAITYQCGSLLSKRNNELEKMIHNIYREYNKGDANG